MTESSVHVIVQNFQNLSATFELLAPGTYQIVLLSRRHLAAQSWKSKIGIFGRPPPTPTLNLGFPNARFGIRASSKSKIGAQSRPPPLPPPNLGLPRLSGQMSGTQFRRDVVDSK